MALNPARRLGDDEEEPSIGIVVGKAKPRMGGRLGDDEEPDEEKDGGDPEEIITQASEGLCKALGVSRMAAPRVAQYLKAICNACDSMPHEEGEHEEEEKGGY